MAKTKIRKTKARPGRKQTAQQRRKAKKKRRTAQALQDEIDRADREFRALRHASNVFQKELLEMYGDSEAREITRMFRTLSAKDKKSVANLTWKLYQKRKLH